MAGREQRGAQSTGSTGRHSNEESAALAGYHSPGTRGTQMDARAWISLTIFSCLAAAPLARADLYAAYQAQQNQDVAKALELYLEMAQLGNLQAQENVASM